MRKIKPVFKKTRTIKDGKNRISYSDTGSIKIVHINLGRYKRKSKSADTLTLYDSITNDEPNEVIGVEVCWDDRGYSHIWIDTQPKRVNKR